MSNRPDTEIRIPYSSLDGHIQCAICLSVIRGAVLTPCSHRYCNRCITEWVERNHRCPCCNSAVNVHQFYSDVQFDTLVDEILLQRDRAEQAYFDNLFNQNPVTTGSVEGRAHTSPFEEILKKHMKSSLLSFKQYFDRLQAEYQRKISYFDKELNANSSFDGQDKTGEDANSLKEVLQRNLQESESLAAEAFDRYLTENVPSLEILPVTVSIYLSDRDIRLTNIIIKPSDSLAILKPILEDAMLTRCDQIIRWNNEGGTLLLFGPLSKSSTYNIADVTSNIHNLSDVHLLSWESRPVFQCYMRPGSEIVLHRVFTSESDLPQRCFANIFQETGSEPVDYFACHDCNVKWICKPCIQSCHAGHKNAPFVLKHIPTWACCYCPKKKLCKIQNRV